MTSRKLTWKAVAAVQAGVLTAFGIAVALAAPHTVNQVREELGGPDAFRPPPIDRTTPLAVAPLYDRPDFVSDEELAAVLKQIQPRFPRERLKPNHVEHALRTWGIDATFTDPRALSGKEMTEFLTNHSRYVLSWGNDIKPLIEERGPGLSIRYGRETGASVHHDHWTAGLTDAGVPLNSPVYGPGRHGATIHNVLNESLRDFRLDERETEWTAMAFGLWLPPEREWIGGDGRQYSFDLLVERLLRGKRQLGVCSGTHRVYSLMLLVRLDDEFDILSDAARASADSRLEQVRDEIIASQFDDGRWPSNWPDGADAVENPIDEELYKQVIATGHHLEWLAIAPRDLHPRDEVIGKAARWIIDTTLAQTEEEILARYTFFSHVGNALSLWRNTRAADFWREWERTHPDAEEVSAQPSAPAENTDSELEP